MTAEDKIEGADITSEIWIPRGSVKRTDLFLYPTDEIKAVNEYLQKDWKYNHGETSGTLPFEIFVNWTNKPSTEYPYAGGLLSLFSPEELSRQKREWNMRTNYKYNVPEKVVRPGTLDFVLYHGMPLQEKPFACIAFEDIEMLKTRIIDCLPMEWNIQNWTGIPPLSDRLYWNEYIRLEEFGLNRKWDPERGGMIQNCWHIPLRTLADLATFTMIGNDPVIGHRDSLQEALMRTRFDYIKRQANGRRIII